MFYLTNGKRHILYYLSNRPLFLWVYRRNKPGGMHVGRTRENLVNHEPLGRALKAVSYEIAMEDVCQREEN